MTAIEPQVNPMGRYSIKETANALCIDRNTLRKYTRLGAIKVNVRRYTNKQFYTGRDILTFWKATYY